MPNPGAKLRALIDKGEHFVCGDTFSAITGRICEYVGFPAAYLGGHACSAFHYAVPDNGVFSQVEQIEQASRIANVISIPLIAENVSPQTKCSPLSMSARSFAPGLGIVFSLPVWIAVIVARAQAAGKALRGMPASPRMQRLRALSASGSARRNGR